jgi:hypothetical protein
MQYIGELDVLLAGSNEYVRAVCHVHASSVGAAWQQGVYTVGRQDPYKLPINYLQQVW